MMFDENITMFIQVLLNKKIEDITEEDLKKVKTMRFTKNDINNNENNMISELLQIPSLETLIIYNSQITMFDARVILQLKNLNALRFENCSFDEYSLSGLSIENNIESLSFVDCNINEYKNFLGNNLTNLEIINSEKITINNIISNNLKNLYLSNCIIDDFNQFNKLSNLETLFLLNIRIKDLSFINNIPNLKTVYVTSGYVDGLDNIITNVEIKTSIEELVMDDEFNSKGLV